MMSFQRAALALACAVGFLSGVFLTKEVFAGPADAKDAAKGQVKYGVVDMQAVILAVEEGKQARSKLETEIKDKEKDLTKQKEALDKMHEEWQKQAPILSEEARFKKQQEFQEKFVSLRNEEMTFQAEIKRKEQQATQKIAVKVAGLVDKMAKEKKLEAVFESNSAGLLFLENPSDLTQEVIANYAKIVDTTAKADEKKKDGEKKK